MSTNPKIKLNLDSLKARREWKRHKVKDGHNVFRILPPFGEEAGGYVFRKWQIIWGLKNPEDGRMRPYASSMTSEKRCPVTEYITELKAKVERMKLTLAAQGVSDEAMKEALAPVLKVIQDFSPKTVYLYNAVDKAGEVGLLELKATAHKKMKAEMLQYVSDYNQDPTSLGSEDSDSGVWFDVTRSGLGRDTEYDVKKFQNKVKSATGKMTYEDDRSPLPDNVVENFQNLAYDLGAVYQVKTYDELNEIFQANLAEIVELCPDADISAEFTGLNAAPAKAATPPTRLAPTAPKGADKINAKFDDGDDDAVEQAPVKTPAKPTLAKTPAKAPVVAADDDFMAQAEALLNS